MNRDARRSPFLPFLLLTLLPFAAHAAPSLWTVSGTFNDSTSFAGTFIYDPVTNVYSSVNITTIADSPFTGSGYAFVCGQDVSSCQNAAPGSSQVTLLASNAADQTGLPNLNLSFTPDLTNLGTVSVSAFESFCIDAACQFISETARGGIGTATAQPVQLSSAVRYAANLNIGESYVDITNTGANGAPVNGPGFGAPAGNICVNVYAFDPSEELISCCSCLVTPGQTVNLGVNADLTSRTLTGVIPTSVTIKLIPSLAGTGGSGTSCTNSAGSLGPGNVVSAGMAAFGTTLHATPVAGAYNTTETPFSQATLSPSELASISGRCASIIGNSSGFGICNSCKAGALGGSKL